MTCMNFLRRGSGPKSYGAILSLALLASALFTRVASAVEEGQAAPEIRLSDLSGKPLALSSFKGKVVLVDFFASWCAPCRDELPALEKLHKTYRDQGLVILGVNIDNEVGAARSFLKSVPVSFPVLHDAEKKVAKVYAPPTMPSSYLIDRKGQIHYVHKGFRTSDVAKIEAELKKMLTN